MYTCSWAAIMLAVKTGLFGFKSQHWQYDGCVVSFNKNYKMTNDQKKNKLAGLPLYVDSFVLLRIMFQIKMISYICMSHLPTGRKCSRLGKFYL